MNTSDPSVHQSGIGTSSDAEHGFPYTGTASAIVRCSDCERLKALLGDLWKFVEEYEPEKWDELVTIYQEIEARLRQEGII